MEIEQYQIWLEGFLSGKINQILSKDDVNEILQQLRFAVVVRHEPVFNTQQIKNYDFPEVSEKIPQIPITTPIYCSQGAKRK